MYDSDNVDVILTVCNITIERRDTLITTFILPKQKSGEDLIRTSVIITDASKKANSVAIGCKVNN